MKLSTTSFVYSDTTINNVVNVEYKLLNAYLITSSYTYNMIKNLLLLAYAKVNFPLQT